METAKERRPLFALAVSLSLLLLFAFCLSRFSIASPWEVVLFLLGGGFFARRHPLLAATAAAFLPVVSPAVRVLLAAMLGYALLFPLIGRLFGAVSDAPSATAALFSCLAAFWLPLPAVAFSLGLLLFSLLWRHPPTLDKNGMISAILTGLVFLLALPLYYL